MSYPEEDTYDDILSAALRMKPMREANMNNMTENEAWIAQQQQNKDQLRQLHEAYAPIAEARTKHAGQEARDERVAWKESRESGHAMQGASGDGRVRRPMTEAEERLIEQVMKVDAESYAGAEGTEACRWLNSILEKAASVRGERRPKEPMTPEERAVIEAAKAWRASLEEMGMGRQYSGTTSRLLDAVRRLV